MNALNPDLKRVRLLEDEMIEVVAMRLQKSGLQLENPRGVARNLLSHYDYNLERVLELAV